MDPIIKKRHRENKPLHSRKRQRADDEDDGLPNASGNGAVALDDLKWQAVDFPERFDNAEGFFGLEEISDVDVLRDFKLGKVEYKLGPSKPHSKKKACTATVREETQNGRIEVLEDIGGEEWEGFADSDSKEVGDAQMLGGKVLAGGRTQKSEGKRQKMKEKQQMSISHDKASLNAFEALDMVEDDQDNVDLQESEESAWRPLGLMFETLSSLARMKFPNPTPIQKSAIPDILNGHDVIGKAPTGSGKTLAFGIPIYEYFLKRRHSQATSVNQNQKNTKHPVAMILSPTRELAHQLSAHLIDLCSHQTSATLSIATLTGGLSMHKQQRLLTNADVIVATPGRLWEVINGDQDLARSVRRIKFLVVDEADRLLSEGHFKEVEEILNVLDREDAMDENGSQGNAPTFQWRQQRQTLVFSATFQRDLQQKLAGKGKSIGGDLMDKQESMEYLLKKLNFREEKPRFIDVNPISQMASGLKEAMVECAGTDKDLYLYSVLLHHPNIRTLIFTNSITSVRRLTPFLQNLNLPAYSLHSQMPQKARLRSIERFSSTSSPSSILIATDVAARGLDIPSVQLVLHYHLPRAADMYVHRSGRTARAENSGLSILLCAPEEVQGVRRLVAKVHARNASEGAENGKTYFMRTLELDRRVVARLKPRVLLSKKISDAALAKEKKGHEDNWLKTAAEDLGVEYDSEEFAAGEGSRKGRGQGRKRKEKEARGLTKRDVGALRAELKGLLSQRVNVGVSERYLTAGGVDIDELLSGEKRGEFLGRIDGGMDVL